MEYIKSEHYDVVKNDYGREKIVPSEREWAEVKRGKWIERQHFYNDEETIDEWQSERCIKCDKYLTTPYRYYFFHHNYCPNCGARMETEK